MRIEVTLESKIIVEFDENSEQFKNLLEGYNENFAGETDEESLAEDIALSVSRYGVNDFIEGVGYLKFRGKHRKKFIDGKFQEVPAIISVDVPVDLNGMVEAEVTYVEVLDEE